MSNYWKKVISLLSQVSSEGNAEEREDTWGLIEHIECMDALRNGAPETPLSEAWGEIESNLEELRPLAYIEDQPEIDKIWNTVEDLLARGGLENEPRYQMVSILAEIKKNDYFDEFGVGDPMMDLEAAIIAALEKQVEQSAHNAYGNLLP